MGAILSSSANTKIYKMEVDKTPSGDKQSVEYTTTEARTFTFGAVIGVHAAGVQTAKFILTDYICTRSGTRIEFKVRLRPGIRGGFTIKKLTYEGDIVDVHRNDDAGNVTIEHGGRFKIGIFHAKSFISTETGAPCLLVLHFLVGASDSCLVMFRVWYDVEKRYFECDILGPFRRPSVAEIQIDMEYALRHTHSSDAASSTSVNQTAITGALSNSGRVRGNFNGAINNFFNNFYANR